MSSAKDTALFDQPETSIFLSYSRDDRDKAVAIVNSLEAQKFRVWWDGLIEGGDDFAESIETALESADVVVALWSVQSIHSHWVRDEASRGRDRGRLVPVSIDGSDPPLGFRQIHFVNLSKWRGKPNDRDFMQLCRAIRVAAGAPEPILPRRKVLPPELRISRRGAVLAGGAALAAVGAGVAGWKFIPDAAAATNSIVVLPFRNMGRDPAEDYFSDGLSEELRATLSRNSHLEVAAQTSSDSFRDKSADARVIASALNVAFLLQGSVRRSADMLRITTEIVDGKTGFDRWSQSFDRSTADILGVQSEIATFVTDALLAGIFFDKQSSDGRVGGTRSAEAFDAYLRGAALYRSSAGERDDRAALSQFDQALRADSDYAAAHAARSRALTVIANNYAPHDQIKRHYQQSIDAARNAVRIAPDLAEGHSALGFVLFNGQLDARAARLPYQRSFELGYGNADILSAYANFAGRVGEFADGRKAISRAQRLDPLNATVFRNAGLLEFAARDYDAALPHLRTALSLNPKSSTVHATMADIDLVQGRIGQARRHYDREPDAVSRLRGLAIADMRLSKPDLAHDHLTALVTRYGDISLYQQAQVQAQWGKTDEALALLERAVAAGDAGLVRSRNDPLLDPIRKAVRFVEIQRRLGFE